MMKIFLVAILSVLLISSTVFAHSASDLELTDLGIRNIDRDFSNPSTPADSVFYGFKRFGESISDLFSFSSSQKITTHTRFLKERLKEANDLVKRDKRADSIIADYRKEVETLNNLVINSNDREAIEKVSDTVKITNILLYLIKEKAPETGKNIVSNSIEDSIKLEVLSDYFVVRLEEGVDKEDIRKQYSENWQQLYQEELNEYKNVEIFVKDYYIRTLENEIEKINDLIKETNDTEKINELKNEKSDIEQEINNSKAGTGSGECVVAGCSSQLCISKAEAESGGGFTTCEYKPEYACFKYSTCEVQSDGNCGWTPTEEYNSCLNSFGNN